jgi:hypothetical protein
MFVRQLDCSKSASISTLLASAQYTSLSFLVANFKRTGSTNEV